MDNKIILIVAGAIITAMCGFVVWWAQRTTDKLDEAISSISDLKLSVTSEFAKADSNSAAHKELRLETRKLELEQTKQAVAMKLIDPRFKDFFGTE